MATTQQFANSPSDTQTPESTSWNYRSLAVAGMLTAVGVTGAAAVRRTSERKRKEQDDAQQEENPIENKHNGRTDLLTGYETSHDASNRARQTNPTLETATRTEALVKASGKPNSAKRSWIAGLWAGICFLIAGMCLYSAAPKADVVHSHQTTESAAIVEPAAPVATSSQSQMDGNQDGLSPTTRVERIKIADARLGMRTVGHNPIPDEVDTTIPDPEPDTWREIHLEMVKSNGGKLRVELLRPIEWVALHAVEIGKSIHLDLPELGAEGPATVTFIGPVHPSNPAPGTSSPAASFTPRPATSSTSAWKAKLNPSVSPTITPTGPSTEKPSSKPATFAKANG